PPTERRRIRLAGSRGAKHTIPAKSLRQAVSTGVDGPGDQPVVRALLRVFATADFVRLTDAIDLLPLELVQEPPTASE
ncbi:hypothetical protein ACWERE_49230, partial [Rhodococcus koreensis]